MRIVSARVEGFRSIAALETDFDGLTALVGSGGVGKSAFLRAVNWFFEGGGLDSEDLLGSIHAGNLRVVARGGRCRVVPAGK